MAGSIHTRVTRRQALVGGAAVTAGIGIGPWRGAAARLPSAAAFSVLRDGDRIGRGTMTFTREADDLRVALAVEATVKFGFIQLFRYVHRAEELWREGKLVSVASYTDDDGEERRVVGRATTNGFVVDGPAGRVIAPSGVLPSSYWHPDTVSQSELLDVSKGRLRRIVVEPLGDESMSVAGRAILANRFVVTGELKAGLWYGTDGTWLRTTLQKKGSDIDLVLDSTPVLALSDLAPALAGRDRGPAVPRQVAVADEAS